MKIVLGKFLSIDRLNVLLDANNLSIDALVRGAKNTLDDLGKEGKEYTAKAQEHFALYTENEFLAKQVSEKSKLIESALRSISDDVVE